MKTFPTIAALAASSLATGQYVETLGGVVAGDDNASRYYIIAPTTLGPNDVELANGNIAKFKMFIKGLTFSPENVDLVAGSIANVNALAALLSEIDTLADVTSGITTLAANLATLNLVAANMTLLNDLGLSIEEITRIVEAYSMKNYVDIENKNSSVVAISASGNAVIPLSIKNFIRFSLSGNTLNVSLYSEQTDGTFSETLTSTGFALNISVSGSISSQRFFKLSASTVLAAISNGGSSCKLFVIKRLSGGSVTVTDTNHSFATQAQNLNFAALDRYSFIVSNTSADTLQAYTISENNNVSTMGNAYSIAHSDMYISAVTATRILVGYKTGGSTSYYQYFDYAGSDWTPVMVSAFTPVNDTFAKPIIIDSTRFILSEIRDTKAIYSFDETLITRIGEIPNSYSIIGFFTEYEVYLQNSAHVRKGKLISYTGDVPVTAFN